MKQRYHLAALVAFLVLIGALFFLGDTLLSTGTDSRNSPPGEDSGTRPAASKQTQVPVYNGPQLKPVDEANQNQDFKGFRNRLITAVDKKDVSFLKPHIDPNVNYSFGADPGIEGFLEY